MRLLLCILVLVPILGHGQRQLSASEIQLRLKKLNFLGSVLYVAAHPDDENTRVIAHLANDRLAATAYLSMTRGDGGQNLIGPEIRDLLGLIRTQELLAARRIDGGQQFFTRANDFGFSKNVTETFEVWNKEEILSDVVRIIRQYQPDVIITRFPPTERAGHGHHTGSAVLAQEAFDVASKPDAYPDQVKQYGTWQVKRVFTNTGRWWNETINEKTPGIITMNVGTYNPLIGKSASEVAAESRTLHKSQGFGSPGRRGDAQEFFELAKGEAATSDIFDQVNVTWSRIKGGATIQPLVEQAVREFNPESPFNSIPVLLNLRKEITKLDPGVWRDRKLGEISQLIQACAGLYVEITASHYAVSPGEPVQLAFEIVNRSKADVKLLSAQSSLLAFDTAANLALGFNRLVTFKSQKNLSEAAAYSGPYWLKEDHSQGLFKVADPEKIGKGENGPAVSVTFNFLVGGEALTVVSPVVFKWTDPVKGELQRPFEIVPPVSVGLGSSVYLFKDTSPQYVRVILKSSSAGVANGTVRLELPAGWKSEPPTLPFELPRRGSETSVLFNVMPAAKEINFKLKAIAEINGKAYSHSIQTINYDHIPIQTLIPQAEAKVIRMDLKKEGGVVGYIRGAGDDVPAALRHMGYEVWEMKNEEIIPENLKKVDAVVLGIRALNTNERIRYFMPSLLEFVHNGGTLITQYNTNSDLEIDVDKFSPYPLTISRDRVTEENSEVRLLKPDHPALSYPNKITSKDFDGWVQERGLYYPGKWDPAFEALISSNDKGELPKDGGLLIAKYGSGHYVYTGLSFFRELPEGVPGAYKLFANLASLGKKPVKPQAQKVKPSKK